MEWHKHHKSIAVLGFIVGGCLLLLFTAEPQKHSSIKNVSLMLIEHLKKNRQNSDQDIPLVHIAPFDWDNACHLPAYGTIKDIPNAITAQLNAGDLVQLKEVHTEENEQAFVFFRNQKLIAIAYVKVGAVRINKSDTQYHYCNPPEDFLIKINPIISFQ